MITILHINSLHASSLGMRLRLKHCGILNTCAMIRWDTECVRAICCAVDSKQAGQQKCNMVYTIFSDEQLHTAENTKLDRN